MTRFLFALLLPCSALAQPVFEDVTVDKGLGGYVAQSGDGHGPGAVFTDLDDDGYPELYLMRAWGNPNELYRNVDDGSGGRRFERVPNDAGAGNRGNATGAVAGDYDNDGDLDLYVLNFDQPNALLENQLAQLGELYFLDVTQATDPTPGTSDGQHGAGIAFHEGVPLDNSLTAAWADPDRDGDLDLYVGNHNGFYGALEEGPYAVPGRRDVFYLNNGDGTFTDATMRYGLTGFETADGESETSNQRFSSSNAVVFADLDNSGWPDLLVTNKIGGPDDRDMLYLNLGEDENGNWLGFANVTYDLALPFGDKSGGAMGVDVGDPDRDGDLDIYVSDWSNHLDPEDPGANDLWVNLLSDAGVLAFVHSDILPAQFSWGVQWQDFDNDGSTDLHVTTEAPARDYLYRVAPDGGDVTSSAGVAQTQSGRGSVGADYDRDGWADIFVVTVNGERSILYENRSGTALTDRHYLTVKLAGDALSPAPRRSSRDAIGARVTLSADLDGDGTAGADERQIREVVAGSGNAASTNDLAVEFGLGKALTGSLEVRWPGGRVTRHEVSADRYLVIREPGAGPPPAASPPEDAVELLENGGFEQGVDGWTTETFAGGSASFRPDSAATQGSQSFRADVSAADGVVWHVQFYQGGRALVEGDLYRVSFDARADRAGTLRYHVGENHFPWRDLGLGWTATLGTRWQRHEALFIATATDPDTRLGFQLGAEGPRTVWFDDVRLERLPEIERPRPYNERLAQARAARLLPMMLYLLE